MDDKRDIGQSCSNCGKPIKRKKSNPVSLNGSLDKESGKWVCFKCRGTKRINREPIFHSHAERLCPNLTCFLELKVSNLKRQKKGYTKALKKFQKARDKARLHEARINIKEIEFQLQKIQTYVKELNLLSRVNTSEGKSLPKVNISIKDTLSNRKP